MILAAFCERKEEAYKKRPNLGPGRVGQWRRRRQSAFPFALLLPQGLSKSAISSSVLGRRRHGYFFRLRGEEGELKLFASLNSDNCFNVPLSLSSFPKLPLSHVEEEAWRCRHVFGMGHGGRADLVLL